MRSSDADLDRFQQALVIPDLTSLPGLASLAAEFWQGTCECGVQTGQQAVGNQLVSAFGDGGKRALHSTAGISARLTGASWQELLQDLTKRCQPSMPQSTHMMQVRAWRVAHGDVRPGIQLLVCATVSYARDPLKWSGGWEGGERTSLTMSVAGQGLLMFMSHSSSGRIRAQSGAMTGQSRAPLSEEEMKGKPCSRMLGFHIGNSNFGLGIGW